MTIDVGGSFNRLESRVAALESFALVGAAGRMSAYIDPETGDVVQEDALDWTVNPNWQPFSTTSPLVQDPAGEEGELSGGDLSTPYGRPEAHLVGKMCVLTGVVRRKAGATPSPLSAGTRHNSAMFGLPSGWRPSSRVMLPCLMGNTDPTTVGAVTYTAWIEVRPDVDPEMPSGRVYFISGTGPITQGVGYIALQGVFPCEVIQNEDALVEDSWDDTDPSLTWDEVDPTVTWDTYPGPLPPPETEDET